MKRTNIVGKARMLRRNCSAEPVCLFVLYVCLFARMGIHAFINTYKAVGHVKILVMRAALGLSIQLKRTISWGLRRHCIFCGRGPI